MPKKSKTVFPKELVVTIENDGGSEEYFQANRSANDALEQHAKKRAATYVLRDQFTIEAVAKLTRI